jgi:hypothetical protein
VCTLLYTELIDVGCGSVIVLVAVQTPNAFKCTEILV